MSASARFAALTSAIALLSLFGSSVRAQDTLQRGGPPRPDTPRILVRTFHSSDRALGVQAAEEVRRALQTQYSATELVVASKLAAENSVSSGLSGVESALGVPADQIVDGSVSQTAAGVRLDARLLVKTVEVMVAQPLPRVTAPDLRDAVRQLLSALAGVEKTLPSYHVCFNHVLAAKYRDAIAEASRGLASDSTSNLDRLCLLNALVETRGSADSIIAVAEAIRRADSTSDLALCELARAYAQRGDTAIRAALHRLDPSDRWASSQLWGPVPPTAVDDALRALSIIDSLLMKTPGDRAMIRTKWLLQLRAKRYKEALATGQELVKLDPSMETLDYFHRQTDAAQSDSNAAAVQQFAALAMQKFPSDPSFPLVLAQSYRKSGQLQQALRAAERGTTIDPKNTTAWLFAMTIASEMNQPDTVLALAKKAIADGANKDTLGQTILAPAAAAIKRAQDSDSREDWLAALNVARAVDPVAPSPQSKRFVSLAAIRITASMLDDARAHLNSRKREDRTIACDEARRAGDMLTTASLAMPLDSLDPADSTALMILKKAQQYADSVQRLTVQCQRTR